MMYLPEEADLTTVAVSGLTAEHLGMWVNAGDGWHGVLRDFIRHPACIELIFDDDHDGPTFPLAHMVTVCVA